jgi:hypothetical protein
LDYIINKVIKKTIKHEIIQSLKPEPVILQKKYLWILCLSNQMPQTIVFSQKCKPEKSVIKDEKKKWLAYSMAK